MNGTVVPFLHPPPPVAFPRRPASPPAAAPAVPPVVPVAVFCALISVATILKSRLFLESMVPAPARLPSDGITARKFWACKPLGAMRRFVVSFSMSRSLPVLTPVSAEMAAISALTGVKTGKDLDIEKLTTNLRMAPNGLQAQNFLAVIPSLGNLAGAGTIDSRNNLDFKMVATLINAQNTATGTTGGTAGAAAGGLAGLLGKATGGGGCKNGTTVPFMIQGTASDPKFVPDVGGLAAGLLKSQLGCAGGSLANVGKTGVQTPADAVNVLGGLFG